MREREMRHIGHRAAANEGKVAFAQLKNIKHRKLRDIKRLLGLTHG
jgi:hypothetical protein